jgi:hypothetical protein
VKRKGWREGRKGCVCVCVCVDYTGIDLDEEMKGEERERKH